jgi:hypothetical protein
MQTARRGLSAGPAVVEQQEVAAREPPPMTGLAPIGPARRRRRRVRLRRPDYRCAERAAVAGASLPAWPPIARQRVGAEHAAVEQQRVRDGNGGAVGGQAEGFARGGGVLAQEVCKVARDGRIGGVGQAEFDDGAAAALGRSCVSFSGKKPSTTRAATSSRVSSAEREPPIRRAGTQQRDRGAFRRVRRQQQFLRRAAALRQLRQAAGRQARRARRRRRDSTRWARARSILSPPRIR